ncbi:glycosyltransferase family 2 protein [Candidatus Bathyarchaeota archaeon]|nr:MAG: glycosyltransferase family 2 protein [Candidatus Bathyarchaeota archaeon]
MRRLAIIPVFREIGKIGTVMEKFNLDSVDEICLVVDDPDETILREIDESRRKTQVPVTIIENPTRNGIGFAIKRGYRYALSQGFDLIVIMAGNGKDDPREIPRLTEPISKNGFDYVQGSRFLPGGKGERTPFFRRIFTRLFPFVWTFLTGVRCTEVTNGFRAYRAAILEDPRINIWQDWLNGYELEYYLHYKVLTLGYRFTERPVSKVYSYAKKEAYSHISPLKDWQQIVGPIVLLRLGARH